MASLGKAMGAAALGGVVGAANTQLGILQEEAKEARQARLIGLQEQSQKSILDYTDNINQMNKVAGYREDGTEITRKMLKENPENAKGMMSKFAYDDYRQDQDFEKKRGQVKVLSADAIAAKEDLFNQAVASGALEGVSGDNLKKMKAAAVFGLTIPTDKLAEIKPPSAEMIKAAKEVAMEDPNWDKMDSKQRIALVDNYAWGMAVNPHSTSGSMGGGGSTGSGTKPEGKPVAGPTEQELKDLGLLLRQAYANKDPEAEKKASEVIMALTETYGEEEAIRIVNEAKDTSYLFTADKKKKKTGQEDWNLPSSKNPLDVVKEEAKGVLDQLGITKQTADEDIPDWQKRMSQDYAY